MPELMEAPRLTVADGDPAGRGRKTLNLLAYMHLRNIYRPPGAGRVARQLIEHLALRGDVDLHLLADPWSNFAYHFFESVTDEGRDYLAAFGLAPRPYILVPGGLHFRKNAELVFEVWPLLRSLHPELVMSVVNHSDPVYAERARALGDGFQLLGFVSDAGLRALYGAARVVWFPSLYEGFGLPVIEAMACGTPVVTSNSSSLPEISGDAALLASPASAHEHVDAIDSLLTGETLYRELATRGELRAREFTWSRSAGQLKAYFEGLA